MIDAWIVNSSDRSQLDQLILRSYTLFMEQALHKLASTGLILDNLEVAPNPKQSQSEVFRARGRRDGKQTTIKHPANEQRVSKAIEDEAIKGVEGNKTNKEGRSKLQMVLSLLIFFTSVNHLTILNYQRAAKMHIYDAILSSF
jgi:hypothetical protein